MPDYVQYHKTEDRGYEYVPLAGEPFRIFTNKPTMSAHGERVWLIMGDGKPREYVLCATFVAESAGPGTEPGFDYQASGNDGHYFEHLPVLNGEVWWPDFLQEQGRFFYGFQKISPEHEEHLRAFAVQHGWTP